MKRTARNPKTETIDVTDTSSWRDGVVLRSRYVTCGVTVSVPMVGGPANGESYDVLLPSDRRVQLPKIVHVPTIKPLPPLNKKTGLLKYEPFWSMVEYRLGQREAIGGGVDLVYEYVKPRARRPAKRKKVAR